MPALRWTAAEPALIVPSPDPRSSALSRMPVPFIASRPTSRSDGARSRGFDLFQHHRLEGPGRRVRLLLQAPFPRRKRPQVGQGQRHTAGKRHGQGVFKDPCDHAGVAALLGGRADPEPNPGRRKARRPPAGPRAPKELRAKAGSRTLPRVSPAGINPFEWLVALSSWLSSRLISASLLVAGSAHGSHATPSRRQAAAISRSSISISSSAPPARRGRPPRQRRPRRPAAVAPLPAPGRRQGR